MHDHASSSVKLSLEPIARRFLPTSLPTTHKNTNYQDTTTRVLTWTDLQPYADSLLSRDLLSQDLLSQDSPSQDVETSLDQYLAWLADYSEMQTVIAEESEWRYVKMTCNTVDKDAEKAYFAYLEDIIPQWQVCAEKCNRKMLDTYAKITHAYQAYQAYHVAEKNTDNHASIVQKYQHLQDQSVQLMFKVAETAIQLFRAENIPLQTEDEKTASQAGQLRGAMTVELDGQKLTMQQASDRLFWTDRSKREEAWTAIRSRFYQDSVKFDHIMDQVIQLRTQIAKNAGFENYRDYMFQKLNRFDYTPEDCYRFHDAVEKAIVPLTAQLLEERKAALFAVSGNTPAKITTPHHNILRPWDLSVDVDGLAPLKAFDGTEDLLEKSIQVMDLLDPQERIFGDTLRLMRQAGHLDIASRPNKRPGGYMVGMNATNVPFIFANLTQQVIDMVTFLHEAGHAIHEVEKRNLTYFANKNYPMEIAELASMSMELITMDHWHIYFPDPDQCKRAKRELLSRVIDIFPWIAQVDAFQHAIYTEPDLTPEERKDLFIDLQNRFVPSVVDWSGYEHWRRTFWHKQGHIFENPFYYIEYGIAELGALQIWRNYSKDTSPDKQDTINKYKYALSLGYSKSIPEVYAAAGIRFDLSADLLQELMAFVQEEWQKLA